MRNLGIVTLLCTLVLAPAAWADRQAAMEVKQVLEERYADGDLAVFIPDRLEFVCRSSASSPWGFSFAGFETVWRGPVELEVRGSGLYETHDIFSIAALTLDYGGPSGWIERSHFGLGLIQDARNAHPPSWGVGANGKLVMRGGIASAGPEPKRINIDPAAYAPKDWDGRLWVGLVMHNVGPGKSLTARIVNGIPGGKLDPERSDAQLWRLVAEHQRSTLERKLAEVAGAKANWRPQDVPQEVRPYAEAIIARSPARVPESALTQAIAEMSEKPLAAERFLKLASAGTGSNPADSPEVLAQLVGFTESWRASGAFGREIGCVVRTATNLRKIGLSDLTSGQIVARAPKPVRLSAARREYEGFQIVLSPLAGCSEQIAVDVTDLSGPAGTIPKANVTVNPVGYVRIFPGETREALVPDPLMIGDIPRLKPGENQPVWITARVPEDAAAGEYRGDVLIRSGSAGPLKVPLVVRVRSFEIPKRISLRSSFWMFRDQINRFYRLDEVSFDDYMKWIDLALEHRLCPIDVYEGRCAQLLDMVEKDAGEPNLKLDFTKWDAYIDRMIAGGANTIHLGLSHHLGAWFADKDNPTSSPEQVRRVVAAAQVLRDHLKERGVFDLHYLQLRDETSAPDSLNVYRDVGEALPDVKLLLTAPSAEARPLLDIPCPLTPGFDPGWRDEVKSAGGEYWWYVCCAPSDPKYANLFLHQDATSHRALFWQTWERRVDGLLYWGLNFWRWYGPDWPADAKWPGWRVPGEGDSNFCPLGDYPGDGFSMYPGPTPSQPLSSVRLEIMRDGCEDYEYLVLLDKLISQAETSGASSDSLKRARSARAEARKLVQHLTDYEKRPEPYLQVRDRIADCIEALLKAGVTP